jgi:hypothetical protein
MLGGRVQEPFLIDPDPAHTVEPGRVIDRRVGVLSDGAVGGAPTDTSEIPLPSRP